MLQILWLAILFTGTIFLQSLAFGHVEGTKASYEIGLREHQGQIIPLDLNFHDENGKLVRLGQLIRTPTILALVYYHCPNVCSLLLQNLAEVLSKLPAAPGKEYTVLALSFDETEKPNLALEKKKVYLKMVGTSFPSEAWSFLTGDKKNIQELTEAVGFHFKRVGEDFEHPVALIILASDGKIVRYMNGADPLPFDLKLALVEASQGRIGPTITKVVRFCFSYDPKGKKLVFNTLKVTGTVTLLFAFSFVVFLIFRGRKQHPQEEQSEWHQLK